MGRPIGDSGLGAWRNSGEKRADLIDERKISQVTDGYCR